MKIRPAASMMPIDEAMQFVKEVNTLDELKSYIREKFGDYYDLETLESRFYSYDSRIGWDTYLITANLSNGAYMHQAVVFADTPMENLK